jgi:hypothetical protein
MYLLPLQKLLKKFFAISIVIAQRRPPGRGNVIKIRNRIKIRPKSRLSKR